MKSENMENLLGYGTKTLYHSFCWLAGYVFSIFRIFRTNLLIWGHLRASFRCERERQTNPAWRSVWEAAVPVTGRAPRRRSRAAAGCRSWWSSPDVACSRHRSAWSLPGDCRAPCSWSNDLPDLVDRSSAACTSDIDTTLWTCLKD